MKHLHMRTEQKKVVTSLIQVFRKWQHLDRAKDCCAIMIQLLARKMAASLFGHI